MHAVQAYAALHGRTYVLPDDVKALAIPVLSHRLILRPEARMRFADSDGVIRDVLDRVPVPTGL
jgi:MoxR-like ATPase